MIQTTSNRTHTMFQEPAAGAERLLSKHEFTLAGEHVECCLACEESWYYDHIGAELRIDGVRIRRLSPVPPVLPADHSWQELFGVPWVQPLTVYSFPWV